MAKKVFILHYAAPPIIGGVESTIYHHARLLTQYGYHVQVLAGRGEKFLPEVGFHLIPELDSKQPEVLQVSQELAHGEVSENFYKLCNKIYNALQKLLTEADAVIVHNVLTLHKNIPFTAALHKLNLHSKLFAWCHDFAWQDELYTPDLHPGYPWNLLAKTWPDTKYVVVSEDRQKMLAELLDVPAEEIRVITPGVDQVEFLGISQETNEIAEKLELWSAEPLVILPARITRRKNIEYALLVMVSLVTKRPAAKLIVTGPPGAHNPTNIQYLHRLMDLRQKLSLEKNVIFLYELGSEQNPFLLTDSMIAELYRVSDLLLFPSKREGFGIPVLEAGLARIPVFAAQIPPVEESAGSHARRFPLDSEPAEVALQIHDTLSHNQQYLLRKRVINQFTWQAIVKKEILPLIESLDNYE